MGSHLRRQNNYYFFVTVMIFACTWSAGINYLCVNAQPLTSDHLSVQFSNDDLTMNVSFLEFGQDLGAFMFWNYSAIYETVSTQSALDLGDSPNTVGAIQNIVTSLANLESLFSSGEVADRVDQNATYFTAATKRTAFQGEPITTNNLMFKKDFTYTYAEELHNISKGAFKFSLNIDNWQWQSASARLVAFVELHFSQNATLKADSIAQNSDQSVTSITVHGEKQQWTINFAQKCIADNIVQDVTVTLGQSLDINGATTVSLGIAFPYFTSGLSYDPDIGALVGENPNGGDGTGSGGGDGDDNKELVTILVAVLVPIAGIIVFSIIVVVIIIAVIVAIKKYMHRFDGEIVDDDIDHSTSVSL